MTFGVGLVTPHAEWPGTCPELGSGEISVAVSLGAGLPPHDRVHCHQVGQEGQVDATRTHPNQILVHILVPPRLQFSCIHIKNGRHSDMILRPFLALAAAALAPLSYASDKVNDVKEVHLRQLNDDNFDSSVAKGAW